MMRILIAAAILLTTLSMPMAAATPAADEGGIRYCPPPNPNDVARACVSIGTSNTTYVYSPGTDTGAQKETCAAGVCASYHEVIVNWNRVTIPSVDAYIRVEIFPCDDAVAVSGMKLKCDWETTVDPRGWVAEPEPVIVG